MLSPATPADVAIGAHADLNGAASVAPAAGGRIVGVVLCHGFMAEQDDAQRDGALVRQMIDVNYTSAVTLLERAADHFETQSNGAGGDGGRFLCAISSVAGDRGRRSNYLYGSTKAALSAYLQGLRHRMARRGVAVVDVRPGFVDTAMTWGRPGTFLVAPPDRVAADVVDAVRKRRAVVYTPGFWRGIMFAIRNVPNVVMHRTKL